MIIEQILSQQTTEAGVALSSKKKVIEHVANLMASKINCDAGLIFEALFSREKLGTTALGHGIAIPHGRVENCQTPVAVCLLLAEPVDYDAPDRQPVDIVFAILVPEQADKAHLKCLADIARVLSEPHTAAQIRHAHNSEALFQIIQTAAQKQTD